MQRPRITGVGIIAVVACVGCKGAGPTSPVAEVDLPLFARAEATDMTAELDLTAPPTAPGAVAVSDGVLHIRGQINEGPLTGDLAGTGRTVLDFDVKGAHLTARGTFTFETPDGTWQGRFQGQGDGPTLAGHFNGRGIDGAVMGRTIKGTFTDAAVDDVFLLTGRILDPRP